MSPMINSTDDLELRISIVDADVTKTIILDPEAPIYQLCELIKNNVREAHTKQPKNYGLFLPNDNCRKGLWLDKTKNLQHYNIRRGDTLEYKNRLRWLYIRTMDGIKKQMRVDDSETVFDLMIQICTKLGIYNHEEYSLISEDDEHSPSLDRTLSMRKTMTLSKDQDKLVKLKRKYHTEDGLNWLNPAQSLRQQGIEETETLLVKRKYFFSDMNIDSRDPIQLSLLYVQLKDSVINGTHPITFDEAIDLGGIQCQVQFGNFSPDRFKGRSFDLKEFLPKEYTKNVKSVEKKLFLQHSKLQGITEVEAKEKYCLLCRSLKTYGITFFVVKEKVKGKNKLIPRLLGVNKDNVVQVDEKTKEVINRWPLTSIKKWAASFSGFTMDFGEYSPDEYYTAQTDKGEKISQLIAGYIDIILKRKKTKDHLAVDADEESIIQEETIAPSRAVVIDHNPKSINVDDIIVRKSVRLTNASQDDLRKDSTIGTQSPNISLSKNSQHYRMTEDGIKQKLYRMSLEDNLAAVEDYKNQLTANIGPPLGKDEASQKWIYMNMDNSRQRVADELGAMNAAIAQILRSAQGLSTIDENEEEELNEEMVAKMQNSFSLIIVHLPSLMEEIKTSAYYQDQLIDNNGSGEDLITAAKRLADAFTNLINAAFPLEDNNISLDKRAIFDAANVVGEASNYLLQHITEQETSETDFKSDRPLSIVFISEEEQSYQEELLRMAKEVANATTNLIKQVKVVAVEADDTENQKKVVTAATDTGKTISQLIATTKIVAPTIDQPVCREQMVLSMEDVSRAVQVVVESANKATQSDDLQNNTNSAAFAVQEALDTLMKHLMKDSDKMTNLDSFLLACENIQDMKIEDEDPDKLVDAARKLAQATSSMISEIQMKATEEDFNKEESDKMINAAKELANATTDLLNCAKSVTIEPEERHLRYIMKEAVERFIVITYTTECANVLQEQIIDHLLAAAKKAATASTHLINTSLSSAKKSRASNYKVCNDGQDVSNRIPRLIITIKEARRDPKDHLTQLELISACKEFIDPSEQLTQSSRYMWPTISDTSLQNALNQSIKQSVIAIDELKKCVHQAESVCQHLDLSAALEQLKRLKYSLSNIKLSIKHENLIPLPDEVVTKEAEESASLLIKSVRQCGLAGNELKHDMEDRCISFRNNSEDVYLNLKNMDSAGKKARDLSSGLQRLVQAARGVAASIQLENQDELSNVKELEKTAQLKIIDSCLSAVQFSNDLVQEAKISPPSEDQMHRIQEASVHLSDALSSCLDSLPGQRDLDMLDHYIENKKKKFSENKLPIVRDPNIVTNGYQSEMTDAAFNFNQSVNELVSTRSFIVVNKGCKKFRLAYDRLVDTSNSMINNAVPCADYSTNYILSNKDGIINSVMVMSNESQIFLQVVKRILCEPDNIDLRKLLQESSKSLLDANNRLLATTSTDSRPGQKECDKAILRMEGLRPLLESPIHQISNKNYYGCLEFIVERTMEPLAESLKAIPLAIEDDNIPKFVDALYQCADSVCLLLEETAQAAYLIGIGDVNSKIGKVGMADHHKFIDIQKKIADNCRIIYSRETTALQDNDLVITTAANIAENCKKLCEGSKLIMASFPNERSRLSDKTKITLMAVSELMTAVHKFNSNFCEENRVLVEQCSEKVQENVAILLEFMFSHHFIGDSSYISEKAKESQMPVKCTGLAVLDSAVDIVRCSKDLISQDANAKLFFNYSNCCKDVNGTLKNLIVIIRDSAPGQKECEDALILIAKLLRTIMDSKMEIIKKRSRKVPKDNGSEETYQKVLQSVLIQMPHCVDDISKAGRKEPEHLAHVLSRLTQLLESMSDSCIGAAAHADLLQNSTIYLEHGATVLEASEQLVKCAKNSGGNPKASAIHSQMEELAQGVKESCEDLLGALDKISVKQTNLGIVSETIEKSVVKVQESSIPSLGSNFTNVQSSMLDICFDMDNLTTDISHNSALECSQEVMVPLAIKLTQNYDHLCHACQNAVTAFNDDKRRSLQKCVQLVGASSVDLVKSTSDLRPNIAATVDQLQARSKELHARIDDLILILVDNNVGTQACSRAIKLLREIKDDLNAEKSSIQSNFGKSIKNGHNHTPDQLTSVKTSIISNSNCLVENIKEIVLKDDNKSDRLPENANQIVLITTDLSNQVRSGMNYLPQSSLGNNVQLLEALGDVVQTLISLLEVARSGCDFKYEEQPRQALQEEGKGCVNSITNLLKLYKMLNMEHVTDFGIIDDVLKELEEDSSTLSRVINDSTRENPDDSTTSTSKLSVSSDTSVSSTFASEEMCKLMPLLSNAATKILEAISPNRTSYLQEEIDAAARYCSKINSDLVIACKNLIQNGQFNDSKLKAVETANEIVDNYIILLKNLKNHLDNQSKLTQNDIVNSTRHITELLKSLNQSLESLRAASKVVMYFRPSSPEWRDVSEKFIGRHVAYHHCYVKSYDQDSEISVHQHSPTFILNQVNGQNLSHADVDKENVQIKYITTKHHEVKPYNDSQQEIENLPPLSHYLGTTHVRTLEGGSGEQVVDGMEYKDKVKNNCTVSDINEMMNFVKNLGATSIENTEGASEEENLRKNMYQSALGVANAMKDLCDRTSSSLTPWSQRNAELPSNSIIIADNCDLVEEDFSKYREAENTKVKT